MRSLVSSLALYLLHTPVSSAFSSDARVGSLLKSILPIIAYTNPLVVFTLLTEGVAIGGQRFKTLAAGTVLSMGAAMWSLARCDNLSSIWGVGIQVLFVGRFVTALVAVAGMLRSEQAEKKRI